jgi:hypothetical protein
MARRTGWGGLSDNYRNRFVRAAERGTLTGRPVPPNQARSVAYNYWRAGGDLRPARGHTPAPNLPAPVERAAERSVRGQGGNIEAGILRAWRETVAPSWIPPSRSFMADDTAAALAALPNPQRWGDVHFTPQSDGTWRLAVENNRGGYSSETILPDRAGAQAVMSVLAGLGPDDEWGGWDDWDDWIEEYDFDVADTDTVA